MDGFGERLKTLRRMANVTQKALAEHLGVVPSAVGKYELYSNSYPSVEALIKISDYFNVTTDYLLKGEGPIPFIDNSINKGNNNGPVVKGSHSQIVLDSERKLSPEVMELVNIYEKLSGRDRLKLLNYAVEIEEGSAQHEANRKD